MAVLAAVAVVGCSCGGVGGGVRSSGGGGADCVDDFYGKGAVGIPAVRLWRPRRRWHPSWHSPVPVVAAVAIHLPASHRRRSLPRRWATESWRWRS